MVCLFFCAWTKNEINSSLRVNFENKPRSCNPESLINCFNSTTLSASNSQRSFGIFLFVVVDVVATAAAVAAMSEVAVDADNDDDADAEVSRNDIKMVAEEGEERVEDNNGEIQKSDEADLDTRRVDEEEEDVHRI